MRELVNTADTVGSTLNQTPVVACRANKPMEKIKNGARYFRNPPQPHMCIQDSLQGCNEPCFINVLSWIKISLPKNPDDPIPLYGGIRVPHNNLTVANITGDSKANKQPFIFAVMANPDILSLHGKTASNQADRDSLVDLLLDFVEAMNPEVRFNRQFTVLRDRDLAGELKDIWMAIQIKREREKRVDGDKERRRDGECDYKGRLSRVDPSTQHNGTVLQEPPEDRRPHRDLSSRHAVQSDVLQSSSDSSEDEDRPEGSGMDARSGRRQQEMSTKFGQTAAQASPVADKVDVVSLQDENVADNAQDKTRGSHAASRSHHQGKVAGPTGSVNQSKDNLDGARSKSETLIRAIVDMKDQVLDIARL